MEHLADVRIAKKHELATETKKKKEARQAKENQAAMQDDPDLNSSANMRRDISKIAAQVLRLDKKMTPNIREANLRYLAQGRALSPRRVTRGGNQAQT